jgi:drug/metabolite transporter (DMT)-like permease
MSILGLLLIRGVTGVILILIASFIIRTKPWSNNLGILALIGFTGSMAAVFNTAAFTMVPLYQAIVLVYLYPSQAAILSMIINGEKITRHDLLGIVIAFIGCLILVWPSETNGLSFKLGHIMAFLGAAFYALSFVLTRRLSRKSGAGLAPLFSFCLFCALVSVLISLVGGVDLGVDNITEIRDGFFVGLLGSTGQLLAFAAVRYLPPHKVGVIGSMEILGGTLFSLFLFHDTFGIQAIVGGILIIYAAFGFQQSPKPEVQAVPASQDENPS